MLLVPRRVRELDEQGSEPPQSSSCPLREFHDHATWVLLGEPGAGKSETLKSEAQASNGIYIAVADFLADVPKLEWRGKTLFLDGLDETRASGGGDSILRNVRSRLNSLGKPPFRIACRAADWFGSTDRETLSGASPDGRLPVLLLEPLNDEDILDILRENHGVGDAAAFVEMARRQDVADLLDNPQTLGLLAQAIRGEKWPETRQKTFELASGKLAQEDNKKHRDMQRSQSLPVEALLEAAGQLCAVLLLSDKTGIALDMASAGVRYPPLEGFALPDPAMAQGVVRRKLFRPSPSGEERVEPAHRSVAEYLAARWLAKQVDNSGLPLGRVLNLLLGLDGRTVAGLRGLYAWLALECHAARPRLIEADPLTVVVYGDVKPMSSDDKRRLLVGLREEARRYAGFRWQVPAPHALGALADPGLADDFALALQSPEREPAAQSFADCVLDILAEGEPIPSLTAVVRQVIEDGSRWETVRSSALQAWLKLDVPAVEKIALLDDITAGKVSDSDDELAAALLRHLFPQHLGAPELLRYLHAPKAPSLVGMYIWFWEEEFPHLVPKSHLPLVLDRLVIGYLPFSEPHQHSLRRMLGRLLVDGIVQHGKSVDAERLQGWLGIGADQYGAVPGEREEQERITAWLEAHPDQYKALLGLCYQQCRDHDEPRYCLILLGERFRGAKPPADIGLWHLERAWQESDKELAKCHIEEAVWTLFRESGNLGLTLEQIEAWGAESPDNRRWLDSLLVWDVPDWRIEDAVHNKRRDVERTNIKRGRTKQLGKLIEAIRSGIAAPAALHELASVWMNHHPHTGGNTPLERFASYCDNPEEVLEAAEAGFRLCPERMDLPTVAEIIQLNLQQRQHLIRMPCLVGMELRWRDGMDAIESLPEENLRRMVAFRLTYGADNTPEWFLYLVEKNPPLVAQVLISYAGATLKAKNEFLDGIYPLHHDGRYAEVARIAVPELLACFPVRANARKLNHLENLLKAALLYCRERLPALIAQKTAARSMDVAQKVYWLATAMLLDRERYEATLWDYVEKTRDGANHLSGFLSSRHLVGLNGDYELSPSTIGKLIELLVPHAELEHPRGVHSVNDAMRRGDHVQSMIGQLGAMANEDARQEIERLLALPALHKLKFALENARHQLGLKQRETAFRFPALADVARILANQAPTGPADLAALTLAHLDDIAEEIHRDNGDLFRHFWTETAENVPKPENSCRDVLLTLLRARLTPFGIDCQPEVDHANDKRADIRVSFRNEFELPIEIKRDSNDSLWTAMRSQLIGQYTISPKAAGHGIYLVLWFDGKTIPGAKDGGKKPNSPEELRARLEVQLNLAERMHVFVRVLDVSWPAMPKGFLGAIE